MAGRGPDGARSRTADGLETARAPRAEENGDAAESLRELPRWIRLYLYGMHGVTLDVLLSSVRGIVRDRDPKLMGFSSPYLCAMHALTHLALEQIYARKRCFRGRPGVFHLVFYPSIYIGLQILIGNVSTLTEQVRLVSGTQLLVHYLLALYFTQVFHRWVYKLRYRASGPVAPPEDRGDARGRAPGLPAFVRFLFFGMHGFVDEVLFTSVFNLVEKSDRTLIGHTSLWSFLMYGSCSFVVERLYLHLHFRRGWRTWQRLPIYVCFIYTWELCWGLALRHFGACSWDYSHYPLNFMGLITLLYLPGWVCISLYQDLLSNVLLRVRCTEGVKDLRGHGAEVNGQTESRKL